MAINFLQNDKKENKSKNKVFTDQSSEWSLPQEIKDAKTLVNTKSFHSNLNANNSPINKKKKEKKPGFFASLFKRKKSTKKENTETKKTINTKKSIKINQPVVEDIFEETKESTLQSKNSKNKTNILTNPEADLKKNLPIPSNLTTENLRKKIREKKKIEKIDILQSNLLKKEKDERNISSVKWKRSSVFSIVSVFLASAIIYTANWDIEKWTMENKVDNINLADNLKILNDQIKIAEKNAQKNENRITLINDLIINHIYWTNFFKFLEENTLSEIYYNNSSFSGNTDGNYTFNAIGPNYAIIEAQVEQFKKHPYVKDIIINSAAKKDEVVTFSLQIIVDKKIFQKINKTT